MSLKRTTNQDAPRRGAHFSSGASEDADTKSQQPDDVKSEATVESDQPVEPSRHLVRRKSDLPADMAKYFDLDRYRKTEQRRARISGIKFAAAIVVAIVMLFGVAAALYVSDIDHRLTENVTDQLRQTLEHSEPGDPFYLLLLGIDKDQGRVEDVDNYGTDSSAYRSDSIMLCRIDPKNVKVTMVSIHRDTLIEMGEYGQQKINSAYSFGGAAYATQVVSDFSGVPITHYAEVDLDRFISIVDVVGGVTVTLPVPVYDPDYTGLNLPAGEQTLNGLEAALLCRCRHGYDKYGDGDLFRAANQRMVFSEIIKKVMSSDPATIIATITTMADSVTTDMSLATILDLAGQMQTINIDTDIMTGMAPTEGMYIDGSGWYEVCEKDKWTAMMNRVNQGLPPYADGEADSTSGVAGSVGKGTAIPAPTGNTQSVSTSDVTSVSHSEQKTEPEPEPEPVVEPEPEPEYEPEPVYEPEYVEEEVYWEPVYEEVW